MSDTIDQEFETFQENVVTKGAKPSEKSDLHNEAEAIGGPTPTSGKPDDSESIGKKVAAKMKGATAPGTKPSAASGDTQDTLSKKPTFEETEEDGELIEETEETIQYSFDEDIDALVSGEELTEQFREKAKLIFEAAVTAKINEEVTLIKEAYAEALEEEVTSIKEEMAQQVDRYLSYVAETWMEENTIAIEQSLRAQVMEGFMSGLKGLFSEHNIEVPEEEFNQMEEMVEQLDSMEEKLNEQIERNINLQKQIGTYIKNGIVTECSAGLAETQKEKFASLAESVEFDSEENFRDKLGTLKEAYFHKSAPQQLSEDTHVEQSVADHNGPMGSYVQALSRWSSK